jgi:WD40 repeat protein
MSNFSRKRSAAAIALGLAVSTVSTLIMIVPPTHGSNPPAPTTTATNSWKDARLIRTLAGGSWFIALSSNGQLLATTGNEGVIVWNLNTGEKVRTFSIPPAEVQSITFSPDGQAIALRRYNPDTKTQTIQLWQTATGKSLKTLTTVLEPKTSPASLKNSSLDTAGIVFSPDGKTLASANVASSNEKVDIQLWDVNTGVIRHTLRENFLPIRSIAFSPDGQTLANSSGTRIKLWNVKTGQLIRTLSSNPSKPADALDSLILKLFFSPDGASLRSVVGPFPEKVIQSWNPKTGKAIRKVETTFHRSANLVISSDGRTVGTSGPNSPYQVFDLLTGERVVLLNEFGDKGFAIAFSQDGRTLAMNTGDASGYYIKVWRR